jgi:hypothetical protein
MQRKSFLGESGEVEMNGGKPMVTYCFELVHSMNAKVIKANYMVDGYQATIVDNFDKQIYDIVIKPQYKYHKESDGKSI